MSENHFEDGLPEEPQNHDEEPVVGDAPPQAKVLLSNKAYDRSKFLAQIVLPAFAVFYASVGALWGFPKTEEVVGTIVAVDLLLGAILQISTTQYYRSDARFDGTMFIAKDRNVLGQPVLKAGYSVSSPAEVVEKKDEVTFKVQEAPENLM